MIISPRYILTVVLSVILTWIVHEFAHWITYSLLGYDFMMTLNKVSFLRGEIPKGIHQVIAGSAGPLITILQAFIIYRYLKKKQWNKYLYPFLFTAFYMRFLAGVLNFINPNDEGAISQYFGIGLYTISIVVSALLFYMVFQISKKHHLNWRFQLATTLIVMASSSILILLDQFIGVRIL